MAGWNDGFIAACDGLEDEIMSDVEGVIGDAVQGVVDEAQRTVPYRTGALHNSIAVTVGGAEVAWQAIGDVPEGADVVINYEIDYASYVHEGTFRQAAQPWLANAVAGFGDHLAAAIAGRQ